MVEGGAVSTAAVVSKEEVLAAGPRAEQICSTDPKEECFALGEAKDAERAKLLVLASAKLSVVGDRPSIGIVAFVFTFFCSLGAASLSSSTDESSNSKLSAKDRGAACGAGMARSALPRDVMESVSENHGCVFIRLVGDGVGVTNGSGLESGCADRFPKAVAAATTGVFDGWELDVKRQRLSPLRARRGRSKSRGIGAGGRGTNSSQVSCDLVTNSDAGGEQVSPSAKHSSFGSVEQICSAPGPAVGTCTRDSSIADSLL